MNLLSQLTRKLVITGLVLIGLALVGSFSNSNQAVMRGAGGPTVTIDPAQLPLPVTGSLAVPGTVAVRNIDEPGRIPYQSVIRKDTGGANSTLFTAVPAGKRLVMKELSYRSVTYTAVVSTITLYPEGLGATAPAISTVPILRGSLGGDFEFIANAELQAYADAGRSPEILLPANTKSVDITLTGYLIDCTTACAAIVR